MSATQHIFPLNEILACDEDEPWLNGHLLCRPEGWERSRNPTPREVRRALQEMESVKFEESIWDEGLCFAVENVTKGTLMYLKGYVSEADEDTPLEVYFDKGSGAGRLQVQITERLTHTCGPLLLAEFQFILVGPGTLPDTPWQNW